MIFILPCSSGELISLLSEKSQTKHTPQEKEAAEKWVS